MTIRESYRILGLTAKAGWEEVRRRFRALAQEHHPDLNPGKSEAVVQFRRVLEAYEVLRARLIRAPRGEKRYYRTRPQARQEFFEEVFGLDSREDPGYLAGGPDFRYDLRIPFVDALLGMDTTIMVPRFAPCSLCDRGGKVPTDRPRTCPDCGGKGRPIKGPGLFRSGPACGSCQGKGLILEQPCPACEGQGYHLGLRPYHLHIPPGTEDGSRLRFAGGGGESFPGGAPGSLEVVISVAPHAFFSRQGRDLFCQLTVSFAQAALGGEVRVPTLRGYATVNLPRGTQTGDILRFPGGGAPGPRGLAGDQIVEGVVTTPARLTLAQRRILAELARLGRTEVERAAHE